MMIAVRQPRPAQWGLALGGALLLHAGLGVLFHQMAEGGAAGAGRGGVEVGLAMAGVV